MPEVSIVDNGTARGQLDYRHDQRRGHKKNKDLEERFAGSTDPRSGSDDGLGFATAIRHISP